jgi:hypothetical protein
MQDDNEIIEQIINSFTNFNLRDIEEINKYVNDYTIAEFILCSCLIDQLSGFRYNSDKVGKRYKEFVKEYLKKYNPDELYNDLRNKLVHNYSVGSHYGLTRNAKHLHLKKVNGLLHLNLEDFILDLKSAIDKYILELRNDICLWSVFSPTYYFNPSSYSKGSLWCL